MTILEAIEAGFREAQLRAALDVALDSWRRRSVCLRSIEGVESLLATCRSGANQVSDSAFAAVSAEAADGDEQAWLTILYALLPALRRSARSLCATTALEPDDVYSEMMLGLWSEVPKIRPDDHNIAGRLLNRARWRAKDASLRALEHKRHELPVAEHKDDASPASDDWESEAEWRALGWRLEASAIVRHAVARHVITLQEAEILLADRGLSRDLCARLGLSQYALQCRRRRLRRRLAAWFHETYPDAVGA